MSLAVVYCRASIGIDAPLVEVEVNLAGGLPALSIVGLPEAAVKESKDRVRAAILNAHFDFPARKITVNLAPADLPKQGSRFDLAIALGIIAASGQIPVESLQDHEFIAELSLGGELRPIPGCLPASIAVAKSNRKLLVSKANAQEAGLVNPQSILLGGTLLEVCQYLGGSSSLPNPGLENEVISSKVKCLSDVKGQARAKRALEIAASGGHNLLFIGSPGTGKSMLASRIPGILPPMSQKEALESAAVLSVSSQGFKPENYSIRPFRHPHHTSSAPALVGGGSVPKPGEISLAHHGVLFLDELPEFNRHVLEVLREPLETGTISISRAAQQAEYPARFQLIAAMNPCPCGYLGDEQGECHCSSEQVSRYRSKISGPLLDRIDMHVHVGRPGYEEIYGEQLSEEEKSEDIQLRVHCTQSRQLERQNCRNNLLEGEPLRDHCQLGEAEKQIMKRAMTHFALSPRSYDRILKVARTIADMDGADRIAVRHLTEAISLRGLGRK
ncbi:MAG: YifB family Mg chelatase-like AAA ATPase [bacterium]